MKYKFILSLVFIVSAVNADVTLSGNETTDTKVVHNTMRTLDSRARHCHKMLNYLGGVSAAAELYTILREDSQSFLGSCTEFVALSERVRDLLSAMQQRYGRRPPAPNVDERAHTIALIMYLQAIDKDTLFMRVFAD